jgi:hypothetical protein
MAVIWVLTKEPYHENSTVLGAWTDREQAIRAFLDAPNQPEPEHQDRAVCWELTSWEGGQHRRSLVIFHPQETYCVPAELLGKPAEKTNEREWARQYRAADPVTFDW